MDETEKENGQEREKKREIAQLKSNINSVNVRLKTVDRALDCQDQYFRRNSLLIHGVNKEN